MSNQPDCDKRQVGLRVDLDTCRKVERKYRQPEDGNNKSLAFIRALEDATRGIRLTPEDYDIIAAESHRNREKRAKKLARRRAAK